MPVITGMTPNADRIGGGASVTITGSILTNVTKVLFGTVQATSVVIVDDRTITCIVPPGLANGVVNVSAVSGTQVGVLVNGFTYYAGAINSVTPDHSLASGGGRVTIRGLNFLTGSTMTFGGIAATGVIFVDSTQFICVVPARPSGAGPVDIVITEPSTVTVTGQNLFRYTGVIPRDDIRRMPSITIHDALNNAPNTVDFTVDGQSSPPVEGTDLEFTDGDFLVFAGQVQTVKQVYEDDPVNLAWVCRGIDWTYALNKKRPFGTYDNQSVSVIIRDILARYAPEFTDDYVQEDLARVSIVLDGSMDFATVMSTLMGKIGEGHWYIDYQRRCHAFHIPPLNIPRGDVVSQPLSIFGTAMVASTSATPIVDTTSLPPGYYTFRSTSKYKNAPTYVTPSVPAPSGYVLLSQAAAVLNYTGSVSNGSYAPSGGGPFFPRGWAAWTSGASFIPEGWAGADGNTDTVYASPDIAAILEALSLHVVESTFSPISNSLLIGKFVPTLSSIPLAPVIAGLNEFGRRIYFMRLGDVNVYGGTRTTGYIDIDDNSTTTITREPVLFDNSNPIPYVAPPAGRDLAPTLVETTTNIDATVFLGYSAQPGYYAVMISGVYQDGTETYPSLASNVVKLAGNKMITAGALPIYPDLNGVPCVYRKIYGSIVVPFTPPVPGTPDFQPGRTSLMSVVTNNTAVSATFSPGGSMSGNRDTEPDYPSSVPLGIATTTGQVDGPYLENDQAPEDIVDGSTTLLKDPAFESERDTSQLRNRIFVKGKGTILTKDALVGDTQVFVGDVSPFSGRSGKFISGSRVTAYTHVVGTTGAGLLNLAKPLTEPILQADWKFGGGTPIRPFVQVDDVKSQRERGAIELDKFGMPTDGIHEYTIDDTALVNTAECLNRGLAELQLFSRPVVRINYATRDPLTRSGKLVHVDLTNPPIKGDFIIQDVTIDQFYDESDQVSPRYKVVADSAARFNLNDLLLQLDDRSGKDLNPSGLVDSAVFQAQDGGQPQPTERTVMFTELAADQFIDNAAPAFYTQGWVAGSSTRVGLKDADGYWARITASVGEGGEAHMYAPQSPAFRADMSFKIKARIRLPKGSGNIVHFAVYDNDGAANLSYDGAANTPPGLDINLARHGFGLRYSPGGIQNGSAGWAGWSADGSSVQTYAPDGPLSGLDDNAIYLLEIACASGIVTVTVNGKSTDFPVPSSIDSSILLRGLLIIRSTGTNGDQYLDFKSMYGERV